MADLSNRYGLRSSYISSLELGEMFISSSFTFKYVKHRRKNHMVSETWLFNHIDVEEECK